MSFSRSCYKCGNVGHFVDSCPESDRLCYNCKQPGHEANQCTQPRTVETKQCYSCGGGGRGGYMGGRGGYTGGRGGGRGGRDGGGGGRSSPIVCYNCSGYNHFARDCQASGVKCYNCGRFGSNDKPGKTCYQCGESKDCTNELNNDN
nr:12528_t:CDS:2 [Entrophospora candida]